MYAKRMKEGQRTGIIFSLIFVSPVCLIEKSIHFTILKFKEQQNFFIPDGIWSFIFRIHRQSLSNFFITLLQRYQICSLLTVVRVQENKNIPQYLKDCGFFPSGLFLATKKCAGYKVTDSSSLSRIVTSYLGIKCTKTKSLLILSKT